MQWLLSELDRMSTAGDFLGLRKSGKCTIIYAYGYAIAAKTGRLRGMLRQQ